jgi:hypothetical protein
MKALISPNETVALGDGNTGVRVAQVDTVGFEVAAPLFWVDCDENVTAEGYHWTGSALAQNPPWPEPEEPAASPTPPSNQIPQAVL